MKLEGAPLDEVIDAAMSGWRSLLVIGGDVDARHLALASVVARVPQPSHCVTIGSAVSPPDQGQIIELSDEVDMQSALRSALRWDPDVLVLAEARPEADEMIVVAAQTGHMVLMSADSPLEAVPTRWAGIAAAGPTLLFDLGATDRAPQAYVLEPGGPRAVLAAPAGRWTAIVDDPTAGLGAPPPPPPPLPEPPDVEGLDPLPPGESLQDRLRRRYGPHRRSCFVPRVEAGPTAPDQSKLAGRPMVGPDETWPVAEATGQAMQLVFQYRLEELPGDVREALSIDGGQRGWWQCFYDPTTSGGGEAWRPFSGFSLIRVLDAEGARPAPDSPRIDSLVEYEEAAVVGWIELFDAPHPQDLDALGAPAEEPEFVLQEGLLWTPDARRLLTEDSDEGRAYRAQLEPFLDWARLDGPNAALGALGWLDNHPGDKLLGWPTWSQGPEVPTCPTSGEPMVFVAQISANSGEPGPGRSSHFPQLFAADGTAQVFRSPVDPKTMTMVWACG